MPTLFQYGMQGIFLYEFTEWFKYESALMHARMGYGERFFPYDGSTIEEDIEVDSARSEFKGRRFFQLCFDVSQYGRNLLCCLSCFHAGYRVEKTVLLSVFPGSTGVERRESYVRPLFRKELQAELYIFLRIDIRPDSDTDVCYGRTMETDTA